MWKKNKMWNQQVHQRSIKPSKEEMACQKQWLTTYSRGTKLEEMTPQEKEN